MIGSGKSRSRREEIRKNRPDAARWDLDAMRESGVLHSVAIAAGFFVAAAAILMLRQDVVRYRPDQWIPHDIVSRVDFVYPNKSKQADEERKAREREPRVYRDNGDVWASAEKELLSLPDRLAEGAPEQLPPETANVIEPGAVTALRQYVSGEGREAYAKRVRAFVGALREYRAEGPGGALPLLVLPGAQRQQDVEAGRPVVLSGEFAPATPVDPTRTYAHDGDALKNVVTAVAQLHFRSSLQADLVDFTIKTLRPTHELDERATTEAQNRAANRVPPTAGDEFVPANSILVHKSKRVFTQDDWKLL